MSITKFKSTFDYKLIYVFRINDKEHEGCLKIGDATIHTDKPHTDFVPNCHDLNYAARKRIDSYTATAGIVYELLHTEIAIYKKDGKIKAFRDHKVHDVLKRSGIKSRYFDTSKKQNEWFKTDLNTVISAIKAVKDLKSALNSSQVSSGQSPIIFRPEQSDAIKKTIARYKNDTKMLWNAKMRFGKTLSSLQVAKEMGFKRSIIITHRPVVSDGWFDDFGKIFYDRKDYYFGSKTKGKTISDLIKHDNNFVYFASMQDLRGSDAVGGSFDKNNEIFKIDWDFVVVDEAHEGTKTELGKNVLSAVIKDGNDHKTYVLQLSGTPFNLLTDFVQDSIYTWDYIMEQEAKTIWNQTHFGDSNPYEELPRMNIYTYHLEKNLPVYIDVMDKAFNFREFFRLWTGDIEKDGQSIPKGANKGTFVHEQDVNAFLGLICKQDENTNYPFANTDYRNYFRHSLWVVPGVKEAKALSILLKQHHVFKNFTIVNVAGDGDEEIDIRDALSAVRKAISDNSDQTYTITLSCGRLTTGVSVPEWTAVLMLAGTYSTAASQYLQTIFRVQTPANINGKIKEECFVFDFAPDRTLKMVAESVQLSARAGANNAVAEVTLGKFLNFCPVIAIEDSTMKEYKVSELLQELKKAYAERVARNGFDDPKIYNDELLKLSKVELEEFENLKKIVGESKQTKKTGEIDINHEGFNEEESEEEQKLKEKKRKESLTEEEKARLAELKEKRKNRESAISILRAISIRMPLLVYGMNVDIDTDVTIDNFADLMTDEGMNPNSSWDEFMPKGVTKEIFKKFSKYYDKDIFVAASRRIRFIAKTADELEPTQRVQKISSLFATFKNPDKETVLTPWRVVNLHLSDTVGGWDFFDTSHQNELIDGPRFVDQSEVTKKVFNEKSIILEINSKTGLYPLYIIHSLYKEKIKNMNEQTFEQKYRIWDVIVMNQMYVICKTPMAKLITKRTLLGYRSGRTNMHAFEDLIMQLKDKPEKFVEKITKKSFWDRGGNEKMKFNAIVGNPPYQENISSNADNDSLSKQLFPYFIIATIMLNPDYSTLITPARWFTADAQDKSFIKLREYIRSNNHISKIMFYPNASDVFDNVSIAGGVQYYLYNPSHMGNVEFGEVNDSKTLIVSRPLFEEGLDIVLNSSESYQLIMKVTKNGFKSMMEITKGRNAFGVVGKGIEKITTDKPNNTNQLEVRCAHEIIRFIDRSLVSKGIDIIDSWKIFISKGNGGAGLLTDNREVTIVGVPYIGKPNTICTDTLIPIGNFKNEEEASNLAKYLKTKFVRYLIGLLKTSQNIYQNVYRFVPLQDFTLNSDINWNKHIDDIDDQLFIKYSLSESEINRIKSKIKKR